MIPKIIHYCWFGGKEKPALVKKCMESWKKFCPDYEIIEWNEGNFDVNIVPYVAEAYSCGKYAFVSDYARFWVLYLYGGLYFDVDVELIGKIDDILRRGSFMAYEHGMSIAPGLGLGLEAETPFVKTLLDEYQNSHFLVDGHMMISRTVVNLVTDLLLPEVEHNVGDGIDRIGNIYIYYPEYFSPLNHRTGVLMITGNTRSIHHYDASWKSPSQKIKDRFIRIIGPKCTDILVSIKNFLK